MFSGFFFCNFFHQFWQLFVIFSQSHSRLCLMVLYVEPLLSVSDDISVLACIFLSLYLSHVQYSMSVCLSVCLSVCMYVCLSVCMSGCLSGWLAVMHVCCLYACLLSVVRPSSVLFPFMFVFVIVIFSNFITGRHATTCRFQVQVNICNAATARMSEHAHSKSVYLLKCFELTSIIMITTSFSVTLKWHRKLIMFVKTFWSAMLPHGGMRWIVTRLLPTRPGDVDLGVQRNRHHLKVINYWIGHTSTVYWSSK